MQRATRLLPIALAMAVSLAPAALAAKQQGGGAGSSAPSQQHMSGMQMMLPGGISFKGQLDHAYTEALNAHEAVALGMNDMAANHLSNVDLVLSHLEDQMGGGGGMSNQGQMNQHAQPQSSGHKQGQMGGGAGMGNQGQMQGQMMNTQMQSQISTIRQDAANLRGNLGDRSSALKGTTQLVSRFVSLYDTMGTQTMGGGGGMANKPMQSPAELVGSAGRMIGETQAALAGRDFEAASLHVKDAVNHLQMAEQSATQNKLASAEITRIKQLRQQATQLESAVSSRSSNATKQAGQLVAKIGAELPRIADATMGGGAGMQQPMNPQR